MSISRAKQRMGSLYQQIGSQLEVVMDRRPLFAGWVYEQQTKCGKPQCKCAKTAYRHRLWCVSFVEDGKSRTRVVPPEVRPALQKLTKDYRQFRHTRRQLVKQFEELLTQVDRVGRVRRQDGEKRYARLMAKAKAQRATSRTKKGGA